MADIDFPMTQIKWRRTGAGRPPGITREYFRASLGYARAHKRDVFEWSGQDRDGNPLAVAWAPWPDGDMWIYWTT
jgi:hypothetical protein